MKMYCYKVKWSLLKIKEDNAYVHAGIEKYGFEPIFQQFDEGQASWAGGWAKKVSIPHNTQIGQWLKSNVESIYKAEKDKADSKWIKELLESGYEFDTEGHLIENEKVLEPTNAELCIMREGSYHGTLFINIGGAMEIYDANVLRDCCPKEVYELESEGAVYEKRFREHEDA